jgi:hypothetical protein
MRQKFLTVACLAKARRSVSHGSKCEKLSASKSGPLCPIKRLFADGLLVLEKGRIASQTNPLAAAPHPKIER